MSEQQPPMLGLIIADFELRIYSIVYEMISVMIEAFDWLYNERKQEWTNTHVQVLAILALFISATLAIVVKAFDHSSYLFLEIPVWIVAAIVLFWTDFNYEDD